MTKGKILLLSPRRETLDLSRDIDKLGLLYIAAVLRKNDFTVKIIDGEQEKETWFQLKEKLRSFSPDIVGITCTTPYRFEGFETAKLVKEVLPQAVVVMGGVHVSKDAENTIKDIESVDIIVIGEGEYSMLEVCQNVIEKKDLIDVKGIIYRNNGKPIRNAPRPFIEDINTLPFPARDLLSKYQRSPIKQFYKIPHATKGMIEMPTTSILTSRGCPYDCIFCSSTRFWGRNWRPRTPENVVDELENLNKEFGIRYFTFSDDSFNINKQRVFDICNLIIERGLKIRWNVSVRVNLINKEMIKKMKDAGCYSIHFGVESGNQRVIDKVIGKGITKEEVKKVARWCNELEVLWRANFMISHPTETLEEMEETIEYIRELESMGGNIILGITQITPGTRIEIIAKEIGCLQKNFSWTKKQPLRYTDPLRKDYTPFFVDKVSWEGVLGVFYNWSRTQNYRPPSYYLRYLVRLPTRIKNFKDAKQIYFTFSSLLKVALSDKLKRLFKRKKKAV
ncbi:B12-binding domain-containing radical SAM protein [Nanoarchaeota archaeon]